MSQLSYSASTLKDTDITACTTKLDQLMSQSKLYQNEKLTLGMTAEAMELSAHQLSELVNREYGVNFSRFIRERRVEAAKAILANEPDSSVLSISLEVGFSFTDGLARCGVANFGQVIKVTVCVSGFAFGD